MFTYKAELAAIEVIVTEESFISKASFLDCDPLPVYNPTGETKHTFSGKRVARGLYRASDTHYINADMTSAYNMMRKIVSRTFGSEGVEGGGSTLT